VTAVVGSVAIELIEQPACDRRRFVRRHDLHDGRNRFARQRAAMRSGPCRCAGSQQDGLELRDGQRIELRIETPVARLLQAGGDAVVDEHRTTDVADGGRAQRAARLITNAIVGRAAGEPIAFP
jgi:hypothetical protein